MYTGYTMYNDNKIHRKCRINWTIKFDVIETVQTNIIKPKHGTTYLHDKQVIKVRLFPLKSTYHHDTGNKISFE
jgi:hypothetical protein